MEAAPSRKAAKADKWPKKVKLGRFSVTVYRRKTPSGNFAYMVSNYADGKRRFDSYATEVEAIEAASELVNKLSTRDVVAAAMTNKEAAEYAASVEALAPFNVSVLTAARTIADCLPILEGNLAALIPALKDYARRNPANLPAVTVQNAVEQFIASKQKDQLRERSLDDLQDRLGRFASDFQITVSKVTGPELSDWLDSLKVGPQSRLNYRRVLNNFFAWAESKGYILRGENPVATLPEVKILRDQAISVYTPEQLKALLAAAPGEFQAVLAILAFAGLRPDEAQRLDWRDIDLAEGFIHVTGRGSKTRTHRHVPILDPLRAWLGLHAKQEGKVWTGTSNQFTVARRQTVRTSKVKWHQDGLRHTFISCRLAILNDTARVAIEAGNSEDVIVRHYRHLRTERQAQAWFAVLPHRPANIVTIPTQATA